MVQIHLETTTIQDGKSQDYVLDVDGQLVEIGNTLYLRYKEDNDGKKVPVTIKILPSGDLKITRTAENKSQLLFSQGKRVSAVYRTPYGAVDIETVTPSMEISLFDNPLRGDIKVDYLLYGGSELLGKYNISLQFTV
ncbi:DUF1934 domain-containing protein [Lentilactobacillus sp. Marseille-Q4993]|uniref:DUF1934 domain-containing protein n=1 Tax=Lentilactobacillus sp. Marseille-Q4993 TaxID=3039492 RepID=UPI0024BCD531|nr:DUF1934 domain-containing protein [Lentilactobacillus sp. Marseille-Q4993]